MTMTDHDCVWISSCACFALLGTKAAAIVVPRAPADWPPRQVTTPAAFGLGLALGVIDGGSRNLPLVSTPSTATCAGTCAGQSITRSVLPLPVDLTCPCLVHPWYIQHIQHVQHVQHTPLWTRRPPAETPRTPFGIAAQSPFSQPLFTIHPQPSPRALINVSMLARGRPLLLLPISLLACSVQNHADTDNKTRPNNRRRAATRVCAVRCP
jgi:hypothetical protein